MGCFGVSMKLVFLLKCQSILFCDVWLFIESVWFGCVVEKVPLLGCCSFINTIKWLSKLGFTVFPIVFLFFQKDAFFFFGFSPVVVGLFCTRTFGICTKHNIFCTKNGENFSMSFRIFPYFLIQIPDSFAFFSWLFRRKNPFFLIRLSVNDRIYSYQPYIFHAFFG